MMKFGIIFLKRNIDSKITDQKYSMYLKFPVFSEIFSGCLQTELTVCNNHKEHRPTGWKTQPHTSSFARSKSETKTEQRTTPKKGQKIVNRY